jgi:alpha-tubulin suppressor-like RCC1 family protein
MDDTDRAWCEIGDDRKVVCWDRVGRARAELDDAIDLVSDYRRLCAVRGDGTAWCWGRNRDGELGDGTRLDSDTPRAVVRGW